MKKLLLTLTLAITALTLTANPVDYQTARKVAESFAIAQNVPAPDVISIVPEQMFTKLYVFGFRGQKGFVIISADDRAIPVLGYSLTTEFRSTNLPDHISGWLRDYENQINWLIDNHVEPSAETQNRWSELLNPANPNTPMTEIIVDALVQTTWDQGTYYNDQCPVIDGQRSLTGCSATAMSQVMKYWNHPTTGHGSYSYQCKGQTLSADFGNTTYEWSNMPDSLNQYSTNAQVDAVATLMYHVGVSLKMTYDIPNIGSGTGNNYSTVNNDPCAEFALKYYFKYKNSLHGIQYSNMTDVQWKNTLKNEFDNARPVIYEGSDSAGGHSFICDGYDDQNFFHFNWGWSGACDGFYAIGALNPTDSGSGATSSGTYNLGNAAVIGIDPISGAIPAQTVVTASASDAAQGYVTGTGTYNQYDTITLTAKAREGYIFDHWNDGNRANPLYAAATSATFSRTAYFKPISKDTLYYCSDQICDVLPVYVDTIHWGIRYPSSALRSGRVVDVVQYYVVEDGQYTLILYQGDSTNMVPVYSETFDISNQRNWQDFILATPYPIDTTRSLWITLKCIGLSVPLTYAEIFSGNRDGMMIGYGSEWFSYNDIETNYTWMIRAITTDSASVRDRYNVNIVTTPAVCGTVSPSSTRVFAGTELTFTAEAAANCKFVMWSDSCLDYQRTLTPTSDTTLTAVFEALRPDTTTYCVSDATPDGFGYPEDSYFWAICVRAGLYSQNDSINSIMIYDKNPATVYLAIYIGDQAAGTAIHQQSFTMTGSGQWIEVPLTQPVACPVNDNLWVTFAAPAGSFAASATRYSANKDGNYYLNNSRGWTSLLDDGYAYSWMVKVVTNHSDAPTAVDNVSESVVTLAPNPIHAGETAYIYGEWTDAEMNGMHVEVLTIDGRTITRTTPQSFPIALRGINAPGTYIIRITTGTGTTHLRKLTVH